VAGPHDLRVDVADDLVDVADLVLLEVVDLRVEVLPDEPLLGGAALGAAEPKRGQEVGDRFLGLPVPRLDRGWDDDLRGGRVVTAVLFKVTEFSW
jgi:hypothetical protein